MKKYTIREDKRIVALKDIPEINVKKGDIGGFVDGYHNLSQEGNCWIFNDAKVYESARVSGEACVGENARVYGNAKIYNKSKIFGNAQVYGNVYVCDKAQVFDEAKVYENALVYCNAKVYENAKIYGNAKVYDNAKVCGNAKVYDNAKVCGNAKVYGLHCICGAYGNAQVYDKSYVSGKTQVSDNVCDNAVIRDEGDVPKQSLKVPNKGGIVMGFIWRTAIMFGLGAVVATQYDKAPSVLSKYLGSTTIHEGVLKTVETEELVTKLIFEDGTEFNVKTEEIQGMIPLNCKSKLLSGWTSYHFEVE